jgi:hypothetical protein
VGPWLVTGDFNLIVDPADKSRGFLHHSMKVPVGPGAQGALSQWATFSLGPMSGNNLPSRSSIGPSRPWIGRNFTRMPSSLPCQQGLRIIAH